MLKTIQQGQLIDEDSSQSKAASSCQTFSGHLGMSAKEALEVLVEVLNRYRAQLVEDTTYLLTSFILRLFILV